MEYFKHKIREDGFITIHEKTDDGKIHSFFIRPNEPLEKYNEEIEADEKFAEYRTQENADAYKAKLAELEPTAEELEEQEARRQLQEKREQVKAELSSTRAPQSNPELAKRVEKLEFVMGLREDYTE